MPDFIYLGHDNKAFVLMGNSREVFDLMGEIPEGRHSIIQDGYYYVDIDLVMKHIPDDKKSYIHHRVEVELLKKEYMKGFLPYLIENMTEKSAMFGTDHREVHKQIYALRNL